MSSAAPANYTTGEDRYIRFAEDFLGLKLADTQRRILRSVANNRRVLIISGNGVGKSFSVASLCDAFLYTNSDSTSLGTSGSYSQFVDTMWRPMKSMAKDLKEEHGLPGKIYEGNQPKIEIDDEWYFKVVAPRDPGDLEGRHASDVLVVIEEADKEYISEEHFDSAGSSITDANDRMIAVANPPDDEANIIYDLKRPGSRWEVIQFSSFESHNVKVDAGEIDDTHIPGLVDLPTVAEDWEIWNAEHWPQAKETFERRFDGEYPGVDVLNDRLDDGIISRDELLEILRPGYDEAKYAHEQRENLDSRWYRRRAGVIPPDSARTHRPFTIAQVEDAYDRDAEITTPTAQGIGVDVARQGGDSNVLCAVHGDSIVCHDTWNGVDHTVNEQMIRNYVEDWPDVTMAIDAQGEGSGLADRVSSFWTDTIRFRSGEEAAEHTEYYDRWTEGLYKLGQFLRDGGSFSSRTMRRQMLAAARNVEFEERHYDSRDATVLKATSRDAVKEALGESPDVLDSAYMAVWAASDAPAKDRGTQKLVW